MPEPLLSVLKLCALALIYLFFFRVLRAVWSEVHTPEVAAVPAAAAPARPASGRWGADRHQLVIVEPQERRGRRFDVNQELTVGRATTCQVSLDDTYVSQLHARVFVRDGAMYVEDLGSTNGTWLNTQKVAGPMVLQRGDRLKVGATVMEVGA